MTGFALGLGAVLGLSYGLLEAFEIEQRVTTLNSIYLLDRRLERLSRGPATPELRRIAWLGDSSLRTVPGEPEVGARLQKAVNEATGRRPPVRVMAIPIPGFSSFDHYFRAQSLVAARPDQVVLVFNLDTLGEGWLRNFRRPETSGWIAPRRVPDSLSLPLAEVGVTTDLLLFAVGVVQAGGGDAWIWLRRAQSRMAGARKDLARSVGDATGTLSFPVFTQWAGLYELGETTMEGGARWNERGAQPHYGRVFAGVSAKHPTLVMLGATLRVYRDAGIDAVVYVTPMNVDHFRRIGVYDAAGLARTLASISQIVREAGAAFADLHALLPDAGFRDPPGHPTWTEEMDGHGRIVEALAPIVADRARQTAGRAGRMRGRGP